MVRTAKRSAPRGMVMVHENQFPEVFRSAIQREVNNYDLEVNNFSLNVNGDGQRMYRHARPQPNGGYYVQGTVEGTNRYIGLFQRSLVGVYALIAARLYPNFLCDSGAVQHWVEMMINDEGVADEWVIRVQAPPAKRQRTGIDELE